MDEERHCFCSDGSHLDEQQLRLAIPGGSYNDSIHLQQQRANIICGWRVREIASSCQASNTLPTDLGRTVLGEQGLGGIAKHDAPLAMAGGRGS